MALDTQYFEQSDFSGGVTDDDIGPASNKYSEADNLLITGAKKLEARPGSALDNSTYPLVPSGNTRIGALINYVSDDALVVHAGKNIYCRSVSGTYDTVLGPTGNPCFPNATSSTIVTQTQWNRHILLASDSGDLPVKVFRHSGAWKCLTAGLPPLASTPTITPAAGSNSYLYAFVYHQPYAIDSTSYEDFGPTTVAIVNNAAAPSTSAVSITGIPVLSNGTTGNYDTSLAVAIYRTIAGGTTLYLVAEIPNGTTTYSDTMSDATLVTQPVIYTTGDVQENDAPPSPTQIVHVTNSTAYYASGNRVYQSVPGDIDSVPGANYRQFDEDVVGISSVNGIPLVFGKLRVWRIDGVIDETGQGDMVATKISDNAGCVAHNSIVQINAGCVWFGIDGVHVTDGYTVNRINDDQTTRYSAYTDSAQKRKVIQGAFDKTNNRVYWAVQKDSASLDCDSIYVLDLRWGLSKRSSFTTLSGNGGDHFAPTAITFYNGKLYRGDTRGFVLYHDDALFSDPAINASVAVANWANAPIICTFTSVNNNFGTSSHRKYVGNVHVSCKNISNITLQIRSINDLNRQSAALVPIRFRGTIPWYTDNIIWGDPSYVWDFDGIIEERRRFPAGGLRCNYKQIELSNCETIIAGSDSLGTASIVSSGVVQIDGASEVWPDDILGMSITFSDDAYTNRYKILSRTDTQITIDNAAGLALATGKKWEIFGIPRNERMHLVSYVIRYGVITPTFQASDPSGANSA